MDFEFDEDQLHLQTSVAEVLAKECPPSYLRSVIDGTNDATDLWQTLVGLDWPGLALPEEFGGSGASAVELAIVLEQLGYVGDPTPFLATTAEFVPVIAACGNDEQRREFLGAVAAGTCVGTFAIAGERGRWSPRSPALEAVQIRDEWELHGNAFFVVDGERADELAVLANTEQGPQVFVVPCEEVHAVRTPSFDQTMHLATVCFDGATVHDERRLCGSADIAAGCERALDEAATGLALIMVGASQRILDMVLEYVAGREQFGAPVGSFQAVKHKAVDMYTTVERARALAYFAALTIAEDDDRRSLAASMAKAAAGDAQRIVIQHGIQLFGGIGFTWENDVHLYVRRAKACELLFGGAADHRQRVGRLAMAQYEQAERG